MSYLVQVNYQLNHWPHLASVSSANWPRGFPPAITWRKSKPSTTRRISSAHNLYTYHIRWAHYNLLDIRTSPYLQELKMKIKYGLIKMTLNYISWSTDLFNFSSQDCQRFWQSATVIPQKFLTYLSRFNGIITKDWWIKHKNCSRKSPEESGE